MSLDILIDSREKFADRIKAGLSRFDVESLIVKLDYGDYFITSKDICIERKECYDFLGSLSDLKEKLAEMKIRYQVPCLLLEGFPSFNPLTGNILRLEAEVGLKQTNFNMMEWNRFLISTTMNGIVVLHSKNIDHTIMILKDLVMYSPTKPLEINLRSPDARMIAIYSCLPSISSILARRILSRFPNLRDFLKNFEDLRDVEGIGGKKFHKIAEFVSSGRIL
jgi:ERCC4-type nuclease